MGFFETFAECSIAFVGFGAVHAALRGSTGPRGVYRAWVVVAYGGLSFVLSILPLVLAFAELPDGVSWRAASALGVTGAAAATYTFIARDVQMTRLGHAPQASVSLRIGQLLGIFAVLALLANLVGWPWPPGPLPYAGALVLILGGGLNALLASFLLPLQLALDARPDSDPPDESPAA
jgi:hypothetical protein